MLQFRVRPKGCPLCSRICQEAYFPDVVTLYHVTPHVLPECHHTYSCPTYKQTHPVSQHSVIKEDKLVGLLDV